MSIPNKGLMRLPQIIGDPKAKPPIPAIIPVSKSKWWQGVKDGIFPQQIKLGARTSCWRREEINSLANGDWPPAAAANEG